MWFLDRKKKKEEYLIKLKEKIPYLRTSGGDPILRLLELMKTAIDYDPNDRPKYRLMRDIGCRFGSGYPHTALILDAALNVAAFETSHYRVIKVKQWHETIYNIAISIETANASREAKELEAQKERNILAGDMTITEEESKKIDWKKLSNNFNLSTIKDIVNRIGKSQEEKRIVIKAIYDALMSVDKLYKIPYDVDRLIFQLYVDYGGTISELTSVKVKQGGFLAKTKIPAELAESEDWKKIKKAGLVDENGQPTGSRTESAILAEILLKRMGKEHQWSFFEKIWNRKNMRADFQDAVNLVKYSEVYKKTKKILD